MHSWILQLQNGRGMRADARSFISVRRRPSTVHSTFSHPHSLFLVDNKDGIECKACGSACSGLAYGCTKYCNFFLHKSCAEFPREIRHPYAYPYHGFLSLRLGGDYVRCHLCNRFNYGRRSDFVLEFHICTVKILIIGIFNFV